MALSCFSRLFSYIFLGRSLVSSSLVSSSLSVVNSERFVSIVPPCSHDYCLSFSDSALALKQDVLTALSFFPELRSFRCVVLRSSSFLMMSARRSLVSNTLVFRFSPSFLRFSSDARVGLLLHECAHMVEYLSLSKPRLLWWYFRYICNPCFRVRKEVETDIRVFKRGGGSFLKKYVSEFFSSPFISSWRKRFRSKNYIVDFSLVDSFFSQ